MTTTPPSTSVSALISDDDAEMQRTFVRGLRSDLDQAIATVDAFQALGDDAAHKTVYTPGITTAEQPDWEDIMTTQPRPIDAAYVERLIAEFHSAGNRAYVIAGHYRRIVANLQRALDRELHGVGENADSPDLHAEQTVLAWAAVGRLGYVRPHDEWTADGEPMYKQLQAAAHRLQRAGMLPEFDDAFNDAGES